MISAGGDRKSTRLNSSHDQISYAVLCLKKKRLDFRHAAKALRQLHGCCAPVFQPPADIAIDGDVGAAEAVDRLLRIANQEEPAGLRPRAAPVGFGGIIGGQQEQDFCLQRVGVLELVDEDALAALLKTLSDARVVANEVARDEE